MKKLIRSLSKNRVSEQGADNDRVDRKSRRSAAVKSLEQPSSAGTYSTSAGEDSERLVDDSKFFENGVQSMADWDEWTAPKEGSNSNRMSFNTSPVSASGRRHSVHERGTSGRRFKKSKNIMTLGDKLKNLEESGFPDGGDGESNDVQSLMAMTTGGMFVGMSSTPKDRLEALLLERSNSDSDLRVKKKKKKKKDRPKLSTRDCEESSSPSALDKQLEKGRRKTETDVMSKSSQAKSTHTRSSSRPSIKKLKPLSHDTNGKGNKTGEDDRKKVRKSKEKATNDNSHKEKEEVFASMKDTTTRTKKDKKKRRSKADTADDTSLSVDSTRASGEGNSLNLATHTSSPKDKGKKEREKTKKSLKRNDWTSEVYPVANKNDPDVNFAGATASLDNQVDNILATEKSAGFRRSQRRHSSSGTSSGSVTLEPGLRRHSSSNLSELAGLAPPSCIIADHDLNFLSGKDAFEKVWAGDQTLDAKGLSAGAAELHSWNAATAGSHVIGVADKNEKIISLNKQLAEALDKMVAMSREQIEDKAQFLKASSELSRTKAELNEAWEQRRELVNEIKKRDATIAEERRRIENLEQAIERLLDTQDSLEFQLEISVKEKEKLLSETQQLEERLDKGGGSTGGGASLTELRETRRILEEKETELLSQKSRIEELETELRSSLTVPQLQIDELDSENKALQGKLKGDRLEFAAKLADKDEAMAKLQQELERYRASSDAPDVVAVKQNLQDARADATSVREDLIAANKMIESLHLEREDLVKRNVSLKDTIESLEEIVKELTDKTNMLTGKVKLWTQRAYEWKTKAESAERRLDAFSDERSDYSERSDSAGVVLDESTQSLFVQAVIEKGKKSMWPFLSNGPNEDVAEGIRVRTLEERNRSLEDGISELREEMKRLQAIHNDELFSTKKRIAQLEGENDALTVRNATLEQISRAGCEANANKTQ